MMKKTAAIFILIAAGLGVTAQAQKIEGVGGNQQIGDVYVARVSDSEEYIVDQNNEFLSGPYALVSDCDSFPYAETLSGEKVLLDQDGVTVLGQVSATGEIYPPKNGIYAVSPDSDNAELTDKFIVYEYPSRRELFTADRFFYYYLEQQTDKMFYKRGDKYALINKSGEFVTDFIYDDVKKRFNPDYYPFPHSYAIVVQDGEEKYIDWDLNEIDLDNYNGEPFITDCWCISTGDNKDYYVVESGDRSAVYNMQSGEYIRPYQNEYRFTAMNDQYIVICQNERYGLIDYAGNIVIPVKYNSLSLNDNGEAEYSLYENGVRTDGIIDPADGTEQELPLQDMDYFYKALGISDKSELTSGAIVFDDSSCADLSEEDLEKVKDLYWNFYYERVLIPASRRKTTESYIMLWNRDKTKSYTIYSDCSIIIGTYGEPYDDNGLIKQTYVAYMPCVGNSRNALYSQYRELVEKYKNSLHEAASEDRSVVPEINLLNTEKCADWAKPEIKKAAAENLMLWELMDQYDQPITRQAFSKLAFRMIITSRFPDSDSRLNMWSDDSGDLLTDAEREKYDTIQYSDCDENYVLLLSAMGIINGMGDETFAPDKNISREEAAAILYRMLKYLYPEAGEDENVQDYSDSAEISDWAADAVLSMRGAGIMNGTEENIFSPKEFYTTEQAIATMVRLYESQ